MTDRKRHWFKWYPADWRGEPSLRMVSRAARSVWVDMLGLMHDSTLIGYLLLNGKKPTPEQLARVLGDDIRDLVVWLEELAAAGVYSETDDGIIYSRKMVRDAAIAEKGRRDIEARGGAWAKPTEKPNRSTARDPGSHPNRVPESIILNANARPLSTVGPGSEEAPEPTAPKGYPEDFERFWLAYPRNQNMSKLEAGKAWAKLKAAGALPDAATMARAVGGYRKYLADASKGRKDPHPAAHAATWLNQRRFEGFLEAPAAPVGAPTVNTGPGWEAEYPETWGLLRQQFHDLHQSDVLWQNTFAPCRPNGNWHTLICSSHFDRDRLADKFSEKLERLFKHPVRFVVAPPTTSAPTQEIRH